MKKNFSEPLTSKELDLSSKKRSNLFNWRGQFSPELIENLIDCYTDENHLLLDPFCGSGTLLYEAGRSFRKAIGIELNPAAYNLSRLYKFINLPIENREFFLRAFLEIFQNFFLLPIHNEIIQEIFYCNSEFKKIIDEIDLVECHEFVKIILNGLVTLLDFNDEIISNVFIFEKYLMLKKTILSLPFSNEQLEIYQGDARKSPISNNSVDFIITSPPYINVFNYHQNYRKSVEYLGWDILKIAKSEIGSNRANRGNRFLTVSQYVIDMALVFIELKRCLKTDGKAIFVVGRESNVLGCKFFNSKIIVDIVTSLKLFETIQIQERIFKNKFGILIKEDLLHLINTKHTPDFNDTFIAQCRTIACRHLSEALHSVSDKNELTLIDAIEKTEKIPGTIIFEAIQ